MVLNVHIIVKDSRLKETRHGCSVFMKQALEMVGQGQNAEELPGVLENAQKELLAVRASLVAIAKGLGVANRWYHLFLAEAKLVIPDAPDTGRGMVAKAGLGIMAREEFYDLRTAYSAWDGLLFNIVDYSMDRALLAGLSAAQQKKVFLSLSRAAITDADVLLRKLNDYGL